MAIIRLPDEAENGAASGLVLYTNKSHAAGVPKQEIWVHPAIARNTRMQLSTNVRARLINESVEESERKYRGSMITLTYARTEDWRPDHISKFTNIVRMFFTRRGLTFLYVWVLELQLRGAPHYHIVVWLPDGILLPKPDQAGWWSHGSTRIEFARNAVSYLTSYVKKAATVAEFPARARLCGAGGLTESQRRIVAWCRLPGYVRAASSAPGEVWERGNGGFTNPQTGEFIKAKFRFAGRRNGMTKLVAVEV